MYALSQAMNVEIITVPILIVRIDAFYSSGKLLKSKQIPMRTHEFCLEFGTPKEYATSIENT